MNGELDEALNIVKCYLTLAWDEESFEDQSHPTLYKIAQECCYGLNKFELRCLLDACEDILLDRIRS